MKLIIYLGTQQNHVLNRVTLLKNYISPAKWNARQFVKELYFSNWIAILDHAKETKWQSIKYYFNIFDKIDNLNISSKRVCAQEWWIFWNVFNFWRAIWWQIFPPPKWIEFEGSQQRTLAIGRGKYHCTASLRFDGIGFYPICPYNNCEDGVFISHFWFYNRFTFLKRGEVVTII